MIISCKDGIKLFGITIVCFCAVFVCTFFLNYYLDVLPLRGQVSEQLMPLYEAQLAMARFTSLITGGILAMIAVIMLLFYIKLYIDGHMKQLGVLKAMGYGKVKIALGFWVFGLSAFVGCALGYGVGHALMPLIYEQLTIDGITGITINFHVSLLICLVIVPSLFFCVVSCLYALKMLSKPVAEMLKGGVVRVKKCVAQDKKTRPFLWEMCIKTLTAKKSLAFFVGFACFCFASNVQMGLSMNQLASETMGLMILIIGVVLSVTTMFMSVTSLINSNKKNTAIMKAFGYTVKERSLAVFTGYVPIALIGFGIGTAYQYGLLKFMIGVIFKDTVGIADYNFNVKAIVITFAVFIAAYAVTMVVYSVLMSRISVKEVMLEN